MNTIDLYPICPESHAILLKMSGVGSHGFKAIILVRRLWIIGRRTSKWEFLDNSGEHESS